MVRTIVKPDDQHISIDVPKEFIGKQVEIIAFTIDESEAYADQIDHIPTHYASGYVLSKEWLTLEEDNAWQSL